MKNFKLSKIAIGMLVLTFSFNGFSQIELKTPAGSKDGNSSSEKLKSELMTNHDFDLKQLHFLEGTWKIENKETYETWKVNDDGSLEGHSYKIRDGKESITEYLLIRLIDGKLTYRVAVPNQNDGRQIDFVLNRDPNNKFSFENPLHDFPKKIQYTRLSAVSIFVEVLGENDKGFSYKILRHK